MSRFFDRFNHHQSAQLPVDQQRLLDVRQQVLRVHAQQTAPPVRRVWWKLSLSFATVGVMAVLIITGGQWWLSQQHPSGLVNTLLPQTVSADVLDDAFNQLFRPQQRGEGRFLKTVMTELIDGQVLTLTEQHWILDRSIRSDLVRTSSSANGFKYPPLIDSRLQTQGSDAQECQLRWTADEIKRASTEPDCTPLSFGRQYNFFTQPSLSIDATVMRVVPASGDQPVGIVLHWTTDQAWKTIMSTTGESLDGAFLSNDPRDLFGRNDVAEEAYFNQPLVNGRFEHQAVIYAPTPTDDSMIFQLAHSQSRGIMFGQQETPKQQGSQLFQYTFSTGELRAIQPDDLPLQKIDELYKGTFTVLLSVWKYRDQLPAPQVSTVEINNQTVTQFQFTITPDFATHVSQFAASSLQHATKRELSGILNIWISPYQNQIAGYQIVNAAGLVTEEQLLEIDQVLTPEAMNQALSFDHWKTDVTQAIAERAGE